MSAYRSFLDQTLHYMLRDHSEVPSLPVKSPADWKGQDVKKQDDSLWLKRLDDNDIAELSAAVDRLRDAGTPMEDVTRKTLELPTLSAKIAEWRDQIQNDLGFVAVRGLPIEDWGREKAAYAFWGIGHHLGIPGAQNPQNELLGHVVDYGEEKDNAFVRRYRTTGNIDFHCDAADVVGLLCLHTAKSGGQSRIVSSVAVFNEIAKRDPELITRMFEPFLLDRRGEQKDGDEAYLPVQPCVWTKEGGLKTFYHSEYFRSVERFEGVEIDGPAKQLLDLYDELCISPEFHLDMWLEKGDMQFISNHTILHARTGFEDWPEKERKRHLLRLWLSL